MKLRHGNGSIAPFWKFWLAAAKTLIAAIALAPSPSAAQSLAWSESRAQIVALAQAGKIADIEVALLSAQEEFERNQRDDHRIAGLLDGIEDKRLPFYHIETQLNQWVERAPQSYAARLLRGTYLGQAAGRARGSEWAQSTSEAQFAKMRELHERSRVDLLAAAPLVTVPLHARVRLMWNALVGGQRTLFIEQYQLATAHSHSSMKLRRVFMASLEPRWGGNYEAMAQYAADSAKAVTPAQATELRGAALHDEAAMLNTAMKYDDAEKKYSEAIRLADTAGNHSGRAEALARLGRAQEALNELQIAFKDPAFYRSHAAITLTILGRKHAQLAGVDALIDAVLERHPDEADLLNLRGFRVQQAGDQARAYPDFRAAGETGDAWAETMVGKYLYNGFGGVPVNKDEGLAWLKRAALKGEPNAQLSVKQVLEAMGRKSEIATAQTEFDQANKREAEKKSAEADRSTKSTNVNTKASARAQVWPWGMAGALWDEYSAYFWIYLLAVAGVMLALIRSDRKQT
jgi:tetratricopeptide (TPR) repeat protein